DKQRIAPESRRDRARKQFGRLRHRRLGWPAEPAQLLIGEARVRLPTHQPTQLGIVAELRMQIERQMIGNQTDVIRKKGPETLPPDAVDPPILARPEIAV